MKWYAYPVAHKGKSFQICAAFIAGCGGRMVGSGAGVECRDGGAVFYGVDPSNRHIWREVRRRGLPWVYLDNAYFDSTRGRHYRATLNRLQCSGLGPTDGRRFAALRVAIEPWRVGGRTVVLCPQSEAFGLDVLGDVAPLAAGGWVLSASAALAAAGHVVMVRSWQRDKARQAASLAGALLDARAVVTWSSAAAVTAVLAGVPVVTLGESAAAPMAGSLEDLVRHDRTATPPDRERWAGVLADHQWTLDEMAAGTAWRAMQAELERGPQEPPPHGPKQEATAAP